MKAGKASGPEERTHDAANGKTGPARAWVVCPTLYIKGGWPRPEK